MRIKKGAESALIDTVLKQRFSLLDLGFLELDMLTHDRVIFAKRHLFGDVARVFLGHIEKTGVSGADQLDLDRGWLRHGPFLLFKNFAKNCAAMLPPRSQTRANAGLVGESQALSRKSATFRGPRCGY
jgi:hypothetical protein